MTSHGKNFSLFYKKNLRTFLQGKNYGLFYKKNLRTFLQGKNYGLFYKKNLRAFLQGKITDFFTLFSKKYGLFFTMEKLRTFYKGKTIKECYYHPKRL